MGIPVESEQTVRFGGFELDLRTRELRSNCQKLILQEQPFQILAALLEHPGRLITRDELTKRLWPSGTFVDFEHSLNKAVNRLREALDDSAERPHLIETLPRRGYRLIVELDSARSQNLETPAEGNVARVEAARSGRFLFPLGIVFGLLCLLVAWQWIRHRDAMLPQGDFQRLTFGRGTILSAHFVLDGQSVIYAAAWDGKPSQLFLARAGSLESRSLGVEGDVLAISPSGELALLVNQRFGIVNREGTLALMSLTGGAARKLLDNVQGADWSPDGSKLVVTHYVGGHCDLEFPLGKILYETTGGAWLSHPRISPRGDQIAFLEHPIKDDDSGFLATIDLAGRKKTLSTEFEGLSGIAWDSAADAIWFSAYDQATRGVRSLFKVTLAGQQRQVRRESGNLTLQDMSRDGRILLTRDTIRGEVFTRIHPESKELELGWLEDSVAMDLSTDGSTMVLSAQAESSDTGYEVYLRRTDGSPALRLGEGVPRQISPDGKWVLATYPEGMRPTSAPQLLLLPTSAGQRRMLTHDSIYHFDATLLPDGKSFLFEGNEPGRGRRNWVQSLAGGKPLPITPEGTVGHRVSPDGKFVAAVDLEQKHWLYPIDGGQPAAVSGIESGEDVIRWSSDGKYLFVVSAGIPARVCRVEVATGRRKVIYNLSPSDIAGIWSIWPVLLTPDGKSYVYSDYRILSDLYLATGLR